jgi:glycosyltransferase involved in cell wall biosynthesis
MTKHNAGRVLFFDDRHYAAQGAQRILVQIAQFAQDAGYDVTVASTRSGALLDLAEASGLPTAELGTPAELDRWGGLHSKKGISRFRLALALLRQNLRIAAHVRQGGYDVVWAAAMRPMLSLVATSFLTRAKVVWHLMSDAYFRLFNEVASLCADRIVLIANSLTPTIGGLRSTRRIKRRTTTLPPGVAIPEDGGATREDLAHHLGIGPASLGKTWVVSIGWFVPEKGHLDVVAAVGSMSNAVQDEVVVLLGGPQSDDQYMAQIERAAADCRAEVVVHDWVEDSDAWMRAADIFVLASRREGVPLVLIEAMQRGAVPVSYRVGATPELIENGKSGLLVAKGSVNGLAEAIEFAARAPSRRDEMAAHARRFVEERHTTEAMRQAFSLVLSETI